MNDFKKLYQTFNEIGLITSFGHLYSKYMGKFYIQIVQSNSKANFVGVNHVTFRFDENGKFIDVFAEE